MQQTYTPQQILDSLHDADVPGLFATGMSVRDHREALARSKQKLNETEQRLRQAMDDVRESHRPDPKKKKKEPDAAQIEQVKRALAPYVMLDNLLKELRAAVANLEKAMETGKMYPQPFAFDEFIFGDPRTGEYFLGDQEAVDLWEYGLKVKEQLDGFVAQRGPQAEQIKRMLDELKILQKQIKSATRTLQAARKASRVSTPAIVLFLVGAALVAGGVFMALVQGNIPVGGGLGGVGLLVLILIPVLRARRKKKLAVVMADYKAWKADFEAKNAALKKAQREFIPLNAKCKELHDEWSAIRKGF